MKISDLIRNVTFWTWVFITYGVIVRLVQYLHNRSLWIDEAMLALNIVNKPIPDLIKPLDNHQGAPFGFLAVSKLSTLVFGGNELALRLFPFLCGVFSIFLFYKLAKEYLKPVDVMVAVGLFSVIEPLLYYSAEFKQYSSDVFFALTLLLLFTKLKYQGTGYLNIIIFSFTGSVIIWFSHPSVFILAALGLITIFYYFLKLNWNSILKTGIVCVIWLISFAGFYFTSAASLSNDNFMLNYWGKAFMPLFPNTSEEIDWFVNTFFGTFTFFTTSFLSGLAAVFFLWGIITVYKQRKDMFYLFLLPIIITLVISGFYLYPFKGRLTLFLIPSFLIFIAAGINNLREMNVQNKAIATIAIIVLFSLPFYSSRVFLFNPIEKEEIKQTLSYLDKHIESGDNIYLYYGAEYAFDFYKNRYNFSEYNLIKGISSRDNWEGYINDLNQLKNKDRVWIVFSHIYEKTNEKDFFLAYLNSIGTREISFKATGSEVYLFNFSQNQNKLNSPDLSSLKTQ